MEGICDIEMLPDGCVSTILSLTSPLDVCSSSFLSSTFRSAAESDFVWEKFLPNNYELDIVSKSINPLVFSSKKQLYQALCDPILIDNGRKSLKIEKSSGKISYILSARELSITWSDNPMYWAWNSRPESRFSEVAELRTTDWLEIQGNIKSRKLSPNTNYKAYLIVQVHDRAYGLDLLPSHTTIEVGNKLISSSSIYLHRKDSKKDRMERLFYTNRARMLKSRVENDCDENRVLTERNDGWMEVELGEFFNGEGDEEVKMSLTEVKGYQLKGGIIIEGIEVRPKN